MRKSIITVLLVSFFLGSSIQSHAQLGVAEIIKAGVKKAIKAIDLKVQRLQNQTIWLQNAQKVLENNLSKLRLSDISEWTDKQHQLYKEYFDGLNKVRSVIRDYHQIRSISEKQVRLLKAYHQAWNLIQRDRNFSPAELTYISRVYSGILKESLRNVDRIVMVVSSYQTQMSDAERLKIIHQAVSSTDQNYFDLLDFNRQNMMLSLSRTKTSKEVTDLRRWYHLP